MSSAKDPKTSLDDLKRRLSNAEPVVVDTKGRIHSPNDPEIASRSPQDKTVLKPQRWF